jgi:hypothetical protein
MTARPLCLALAYATLAIPAASAGAAVQTSMSRAQVATRLGDEFRFVSTVRNTGARPLPGLVAHLDVVSRRGDVYVDPEDWSSERTRYLRPLAAGAARRIAWRVKAVNAGDVAVYVVVLGDRRPQAGPGLDVRVAERRPINAGGVLVLVLGLPVLLGLALLAVHRRRVIARA